MGATERDECLRAAWKAMVAGRTEASRFVFVDECSTNTSLRLLYAWSRRGERAPCTAPRNWGKNVTLLASMTLLGLGPALAAEGATTRTVFEAYVEKALVPSLRPGQVVRELIEERGCEFVYLPPYSPDFNPIEQAFSKVKAIVCRAEDRTREALVEAMGAALSAASAARRTGRGCAPRPTRSCWT